jgi:hypothetical protein
MDSKRTNDSNLAIFQPTNGLDWESVNTNKLDYKSNDSSNVYYSDMAYIKSLNTIILKDNKQVTIDKSILNRMRLLSAQEPTDNVYHLETVDISSFEVIVEHLKSSKKYFLDPTKLGKYKYLYDYLFIDQKISSEKFANRLSKYLLTLDRFQISISTLCINNFRVSSDILAYEGTTNDRDAFFWLDVSDDIYVHLGISQEEYIYHTSNKKCILLLEYYIDKYSTDDCIISVFNCHCVRIQRVNINDNKFNFEVRNY